MNFFYVKNVGCYINP